MLRVTIDGDVFSFPEGTLLLHALLRAGRQIPHLCHDDRLKPHGGCRLCLVEVDGAPRPVASCATMLVEDMVIQTDTPALLALQQTHLSLLAADTPAAAGNPIFRSIVC